MLHLGLSADEETAFNDALRSGQRTERYIARFLDKNSNPISKNLLFVEGEVEVDDTSPKDQPNRFAYVTILDPHNRFPVDATYAPQGAAWAQRQLELVYEVWVQSLERWIPVPVFTGPIWDVDRDGIALHIDAHGREAEHLPRHFFPHAFSIRKGTKVHQAIRHIMRERGETNFSLDITHRGLRKDKTFGIRQCAWPVIQRLADLVDKQLFYRANGVLCMRDYPTTPVWRFTEGKNALLTEDAKERMSRSNVIQIVIAVGESKPFKEEKVKHTSLTAPAAIGATSIQVEKADEIKDDRKIVIGQGSSREVKAVDPSYVQGNLTVPLSAPLTKRHPRNAPVALHYEQTRTKRIYGRARLRQHPLSAENLSDGLRPTIWIEHFPRIHKKKHLEEKAEAILERKKRGLEDELSFVFVPVPHLEPGDRVAVDVNGHMRTIRLRRFTIPLKHDVAARANWLQNVEPERPANRGNFADVNRQTEISVSETFRDSEGGGTSGRPRSPLGDILGPAAPHVVIGPNGPHVVDPIKDAVGNMQDAADAIDRMDDVMGGGRRRDSHLSAADVRKDKGRWR